jgi:hypothetical protein
MNWKNVAHLIRVDMKSGRLIRGRRLTKYRESRFFTYLLYGGALALGLAVGAIAVLIYTGVSVVLDQRSMELFNQAVLNFFIALPTLVLIYNLVFTMLQQIQRSGMKFSVQAPYWLPITWEEHTLASILANLLGFPSASVVFIGSAIIVFSVFMGQVAYAVLTFFALLISAFMASAITEIFRVLQVRFIGAVYKSSGRAAVWVRFVGSLLFFIVFYIVYFSIISGAGAITFVQTVTSAQSAVWFVPFVWLGMTLYSFINGLLSQALMFMILSLLFILSMFYAAVILNRRFGLYEPPAITVSRGIYAPRTGLLGRLGFSTVEAALIKKDLKAFTRRRELMFVFVLPIVIIIMPLMQSLGAMNRPALTGASLSLFALVFLMPGALIAISIGNIIIGEEGGAMWRIYSAPISAKSLVKSKYFFMVLFSILVIIVTGIVGIFAFHPSLRAIIVALIESLILMFAIGAVSLANGIEGADFTELPRPRMIRTMWALINLIACFLVASAILAPIIAYVLPSIITQIIPSVSMKPVIDLYQAVVISAVIAVVVTFVAYKLALKNAGELLAKAET